MKLNKNVIINGAMILGIMLLAAGARMLFADVPNITPILAMALFAGAMFKNNIAAYIIPVGAMIVSDAFIGFHDTSYAVYLSFGLIAYLGTRTKKNSALSVGTFSLASALLFFITTNFAVWAMGSWYPMTFEGLIECYSLAIPFFRNTVVSTLIFSGIIFGVNSLLVLNQSLETVKVKK